MKYFVGIIFFIGILFGGRYLYQEYMHIQKEVSFLSNELSQYELSPYEVKDLKSNIQNLRELLVNKEKEEQKYILRVGGDMMLDRGVKARVNSLGGSYDVIFDLIREDLIAADMVFANLEGSISDIGADTGKPYSFRFEPEVAKALKNAGIDIVSLANNHMLDWGRDSLCATLTHLKNVEIASVGAGCNTLEAEAPHIIRLGNTNIALLAYTEFYQGAHATETRAGMSEYNISKIIQRIEDLKKNEEIDLVFVSMHWGDEYKTRAVMNQVEIGKKIIDAGADVIIGHHPHVAQEIERYGKGWIIYSLGNFVFDQSWSEETMKGLMADIYIQNKRVYDIIPRPLQLNNNFQPYLVNESS